MVMFAGMGIGLVLMVGAGVDYTRAIQFKSSLQALADASVLAGASVYVSDASSPQRHRHGHTATGMPASSRLPVNNAVGTPNFSTTSDAGGYYVHVSVPTSTIKTTFLSLVTSTIGVTVTRDGQGSDRHRDDQPERLDQRCRRRQFDLLVQGPPGQFDPALQLDHPERRHL